MLPEANFIFFLKIAYYLSIYNIDFMIFDMRYIAPIKVKVLMVMFYAIGIVGIIVALSEITPPSMKIMVTFMGIINIGMGAFFTFLFLTQIQAQPDKRKKKKKSKSD